MTDADHLRRRTVVPIEVDPLIAVAFDRDRVTGLRHDVAGCAQAAGLAGERLDDFVLAVNELITNAVRHGGGQGRLRLWRQPGMLCCEVTDAGPGITPARLDDESRPAPDSTGGWGLWLTRQLSDEMTIDTGPTGTTVRITAAVPTTHHLPH
ncbi:ATP-binding protein [Micromonospora sp. CPCC 206060]|uniref:ATP-binding protein n=1 Tax=Micromonospora sp. CPCC 206060 TaxID=3122406 RepID=UPI002FEFAD71